MALFNITSAPGIKDQRDFKASNAQIHVDTVQLEVSELQITEQEWLGNFI